MRDYCLLEQDSFEDWLIFVLIMVIIEFINRNCTDNSFSLFAPYLCMNYYKLL